MRQERATRRGQRQPTTKLIARLRGPRARPRVQWSQIPEVTFDQAAAACANDHPSACLGRPGHLADQAGIGLHVHVAFAGEQADRSFRLNSPQRIERERRSGSAERRQRSEAIEGCSGGRSSLSSTTTAPRRACRARRKGTPPAAVSGECRRPAAPSRARRPRARAFARRVGAVALPPSVSATGSPPETMRASAAPTTAA
jgi:hypothetical protein